MVNDRLSQRGGADRYLLSLLDGLGRRARTMLAAGWDDGSLEQPEKNALGPWRRLKGLDRSGLSGRGGRAAVRRFKELIEEFRPGAIHLHNIMDPDLVAAAGGRGVITVHDHRFFCPGLGKLTPGGEICGQVMGPACLDCFTDADYGRRLLDLTRRRLEAAAGLARAATLSNYMAAQLRLAWRAAGLEPPRVEVLPPFVHRLDALPRRGAGGYHLLACRLTARKGVSIALRAALEHDAGLPLLTAGDGPLAQEVARRADASGGRLVFLGWAGRRRMSELLAGARSLWLPSLWAEPFGLAGLEALSLGVPVIASAVGGTADWLEPGGLPVPPGDAGALAQAARRLARDPELARELGRLGRRRAARDFAPGPIIDRLLKIYADIAHGEAKNG